MYMCMMQNKFIYERNQYTEYVLLAESRYPEFNVIELWWAARKAEIRAELRRTIGTLNLKNLKGLLKEKFNEGSVDKIRDMFHKSCRNMSLYKLGVAAHDVPYMAKQRKSHRGVPQNTLDAVIKQRENKSK